MRSKSATNAVRWLAALPASRAETFTPSRMPAVAPEVDVTSARMAPLAVAILTASALTTCDRRRTSDATTAKPRPAGPARAASIAALIASRLV